MVKFLLILILIIYLLYRVWGFFVSLIFGPQQQRYQQQQQSSNQQHAHKPPNSNVNVDYVPKKDRKSGEDFEGGQYVDFEEVK